MYDYALGVNIRRYISNTGQLREFILKFLEDNNGIATPFMQGYRDEVLTSIYQNTVDKRFLRRWDRLTGQHSPDMRLPKDLEPVVRNYEDFDSRESVDEEDQDLSEFDEVEDEDIQWYGHVV